MGKWFFSWVSDFRLKLTQDISDGKADYIWTRASDGATYLWLNNYPNQPTWVEKGQIAGGVGTGGHNVKYATLQRTGRASYIAVNPINGAIAAWLNGCSNLGSNNGRNVVQIDLEQRQEGVDIKYQWRVFDNNAGRAVDICNANPIKTADAGNVGIDNPPFPESISSFTSHGINSCTYRGPKNGPGVLSCPGIGDVQCDRDKSYGVKFNCGNRIATPIASCRF